MSGGYPASTCSENAAQALPTPHQLALIFFCLAINISKATALTRIDIFNTTQSAFEPQLKEIDLSKNTELETVALGGSSYKKGELTSLDFTNNTKLTQISSENNKLTAVTGIPVSVKNIYLKDNELASLTVPEFTTKGTIQIQNNKFTLATLPTKPAITTASKYTYAPQPAYQVAEAITDQNNLLDLSSQLIATGVASEPQTTTFKFLAGTTELKENEDYKIVEPGKFTFLKSQTEKVHAVMTTDAFPKFTGNNAYVTTEFTVNVTEQASEATSIFSATPIKAWDAPAGVETEISSEVATIAGGKLFAINQQADAKAMIKNQGGEFAFQCTNNNTFFKIVLDKALEAGDVISIRMQSRTDTDLGLFFAATDSRPNETTTSIILPTAQSQAWTDAPTYTVKTDDGICGQSTFYAFRATAKSTYFNTFTITRK